MGAIIAVVVLVVVIGGYLLIHSKLKKKAKNCKSCDYRYQVSDLISYRGEKKGAMNTSFVYVTMKCPKCNGREEKCIEVTYDPNFENIEDGIKRYYGE